MSTETVVLDMPAATFAALRAQAKELNIAGRGSMRKGELMEAVSAEITRRAAQALVDGTDEALRVEPGDGGYRATVPADNIKIMVSVDNVNESLRRIGRDDITVTAADIEAAGMVPVSFHAPDAPQEETSPAPIPSPLVIAARLARTRTGRRDFPAVSKRSGKGKRRKGGRK